MVSSVSVRISGRLHAVKRTFVIYSALEEVGNGFLTAVRMVWEAGAWGAGEVVEHEERREVSELQ